jgi:uncharacterized damage-inducible protein DinB
MYMTNALESMKNLLFEELELGVRTSCKLLAKVRQEEWEFRPAATMRTLRELALHLIAIPAVDLAIVRESAEAEVRQLEKEFEALNGHQAYAEAMERGLEQLKSYYDAMSDADFLGRVSTPFYSNHGEVQAKWLVETATHLFHHRAQLFQYVKQLGHDVSMFDLYAV